MKMLKSAILTLSILIGLLCCYMIFKFDSDYLLKLTAQAYESKNYSKARTHLEVLKKKTCPKADLIEGYLERAEHHLENSDFAFTKAYESTNDSEIHLEASFNLLINSYEKENFSFIREHLEKIESYSTFHHFFAALLNYHDRDYLQAYQNFMESQKRDFYSPWMEQEWVTRFSKTFEITKIAHCLIEMGEFHNGRLLLEKHFKSFEENSDEANFLIGISYLKEAEANHYRECSFFFEKAHLFLQTLPLHREEYQENKKIVAPYYENWLGEILSNSLTTELSKALEQVKDLKLFNKKMIASIFRQLELEKNSENKSSFIALLNTVKPFATQVEPFQKPFSLYCKRALKELILSENREDLQLIGWEIEKACNLSQEEMEQFIGFIEEQTLLALSFEEEELQQAYALLLFWDRLERQDTKRWAFLERLTFEVKELWATQPKKALELSKIIDQFAHLHHKSLVRETIFELLQEVQAEKKSSELKEAYLYFNY